MSNFALTRCTNGTFKVEGEDDNENAAKIGFHQYCAALYNEKTIDVDSQVALFNETLDPIKMEHVVVVQPKSEEPQGE